MQEIAAKVLAVYRKIQPLDSDPMLDFDERDLFNLAKLAFRRSRLNIRHRSTSRLNPNPETMLNVARNPRIPTLHEAMRQSLTPAEIEAFRRRI